MKTKTNEMALTDGESQTRAYDERDGETDKT